MNGDVRLDWSRQCRNSVAEHVVLSCLWCVCQHLQVHATYARDSPQQRRKTSVSSHDTGCPSVLFLMHGCGMHAKAQSVEAHH